MLFDLLRVIGIFGLFKLVQQTLGLPGNPDARAKKIVGSIKTVENLREEFGSKLSEPVYDIFRDAVRHHLAGNLWLAHHEYLKLCRLGQANDIRYNLFLHSQTLQHNWRLLIEKLRPRPIQKTK